MILIDIICNTDFRGLARSAAHYIPGDVIQRYHGTILSVDDCNTMPVLECAADSVLHTRYVIHYRKLNRITNRAAKNFFAGVCNTIQDLFVSLHRRF